MFKRVLLCYDSTEAGRRALRRGAELAVLLGAQVFVLSIVSDGVANAAILAGAAGQACIVDEPAQNRKLLSESIDWLKARGLSAEGYLTGGDYIEQIIAFSDRLKIDLIVLGHYPRSSGGFWWSGAKRASLADRVNCCVFVAVNAADEPGSVPK
ncbi:MAG TPA: universal stress protein [Steroidobacteraceae bacterium]|jgi:nucleotide-binding universal stress UspA family protein|nr:universal stress protein [Steroidobacteraceae bacterium]